MQCEWKQGNGTIQHKHDNLSSINLYYLLIQACKFSFLCQLYSLQIYESVWPSFCFIRSYSDEKNVLQPLKVSDVPESFLSSQSHEPFESESSETLSSRVRLETWLGWVKSESSHKNGRVTSSHWFTSSSQCRVIQIFKLFLCIFGYRSTSGPSVAIGPPVDLQWL